MARTGRKPRRKTANDNAAAPEFLTTATAEGETMRDEGETPSGYFRRVFGENPKLLRGKSNQEVLQRWLDDHPGEIEVPTRIKNILSNIKSVLRKQLRKRRGRRKEKEQVPELVAPEETSVPAPDTGNPPLESLEEQIDNCLSVAKSLDREGLADVIVLLRQARNRVVWKLGQ